MTNADVTGIVTFNTVTKKFTLQDTTDYGNLDVDPVVGLITATGPSLTAFLSMQNPASPFLDTGAGDLTSSPRTLPQTSGEIQQGAYAFAYTANVDYIVSNYSIIDIYTGSILVDGDVSYMENGDTLTISGATNPGNNGAKTVLASTYIADLDQTTVVLNAVLTAETGSPAVFAYSENKDYTATLSYNYTTCEEVTPAITASYSCDGNGTLTAYDSTVYGDQAISARTMRVDYPAGLKNPTPNPTYLTNTSTSGTAPVTIAPLSTGTYQASLDVTVQCTQDDDLVVQYDVSTVDVITVTCSTGLCDVDTCVARIQANYTTDIASTGQSALTTTMIQLGVLYGRYLTAKQCGDTTTAATVSSEIQELIGDECTCSETTTDVPEWIGDPYGGTQPNWQFNSYIEIYHNKVVVVTPTTDGSDEVEITNDIFANVGDAIEFTIVGTASGGASTMSIVNTTTSATLFSQSIGDTDTLNLTVRLTLGDGNTLYKVTTGSVTDGGTGATTYLSAASTSSTMWSFDTNNVFDLSPNANGSYNVIEVKVIKATNYADSL